MTLPLVSIVVLNLNKKEDLRKSLDSLRVQSLKSFEAHIIDGGSTDGSADLFAEYQDIITTAVSEKDRNLFHAMNKGILKSRADYLLIMPSGDFLENPDVLAKFFSETHDADIVYGNLVTEKAGVYQTLTTDLYWFLKAKDCLHQQASFYRRDLFERHGLLPEDLYIGEQIYCLNLLYQRKLRIKHRPHNVCIYDFNGGWSITNAAICQKELDDFVAEKDASDEEIFDLIRCATVW